MATMKACVQWARKDGFFPVYIRVNHKRSTLYIKTGKMVTKRELSKSKDITDPVVMKFCTTLILDYMEKLNRVDIRGWTCRMIVDYLEKGDEDLCFSDYARKHIDRLTDNGQERNAKNYRLALQHMERFFGTTKVKFSQLTSTNMNKWIKTMEQTNRAKEMYPVCMRQVFRAATTELNDYDTGLVRVKTNPWVKVKIPQAERPEKKAVSAEECRKFFAAPLPESKMKSPLDELGRDVAMMVLCLAGINTVDLYNLKKEGYHGGIIHYRRAKTMRSRADGAYFEMRVPEILKPLFEKYASDDEWLFNFHQRHTTSDSFCANVNIGIKAVCESMGIPKEQWYCVYTFRHTWGTVAQNDCGASIDEVAFGMNHSAGHRITRGYIKLDFGSYGIRIGKVKTYRDDECPVSEVKHCTLERSELCVCDTGAIYVAANNRRAVVRGNCITGYRGRRNNHAIYVDDGAYNVEVTGNSVHDCPTGYAVSCREAAFDPESPTYRGYGGGAPNSNRTVTGNVTESGIWFGGSAAQGNVCAGNLVEELTAWKSRIETRE